MRSVLRVRGQGSGGGTSSSWCVVVPPPASSEQREQHSVTAHVSRPPTLSQPFSTTQKSSCFTRDTVNRKCFSLVTHTHVRSVHSPTELNVLVEAGGDAHGYYGVAPGADEHERQAQGHPQKRQSPVGDRRSHDQPTPCCQTVMM